MTSSQVEFDRQTCDAEGEAPLLVWEYRQASDETHIAMCPDAYDGHEYRALVHVDDLPRLTGRIVRGLRQLKQKKPSSQHFFSLHRVLEPGGAYLLHLSSIVLSQHAGKIRLVGIDYVVDDSILHQLALARVPEALHARFAIPPYQ